MGFPSIFTKILSRLQPVYDVAQFGEDISLIPARAADVNYVQAAGQTRIPLVPADEMLARAATVFDDVAAGATYAVYEFKIDMPAWIFSLFYQIRMASLVAGGQLTMTWTIETPEARSPLYTRVINFADALVHLEYDFVALCALIPQHGKLVLTLTNTGAQVLRFYYVTSADVTTRYRIHLHPHLNHADYIFGTERAT